MGTGKGVALGGTGTGLMLGWEVDVCDTWMADCLTASPFEFFNMSSSINILLPKGSSGLIMVGRQISKLKSRAKLCHVFQGKID